jgi:hypothetical protein
MKKTTFYLIALVAIMITSFGAMAQNSGSSPYLGSTHTYTSAKSAMTGTTMSWTISEGGTLTEIGTDKLSATVLWTAIGTHKVFVTETTSGPNGCSTKREFNVNVIANNFNLTVTAPGPYCAAGSGTVIADGATSPGNTTIVFNVAFTGDNTKTSTFDYALTTTTSAVISSVAISGGIYSGTSLTGSNKTIPSGTSSFTVTAVVASRFDTVDAIKLAITNGKDFYGTPENLTSAVDNEATATINAVPNTTAISAN